MLPQRPNHTSMPTRSIVIRDNLQTSYPDVYTSEVMAALEALAPLNKRVEAVMASIAQIFLIQVFLAS